MNIDKPFTEEEAKDLVEKLGAVKLVHFRDTRERNEIVNRILKEYSGDTLVSLISLVSESTHDQIVRNAYQELTPLARNAFLYTSLLYRFNIKMPASLLRGLLGKTWEELTKEVLQYDSKGILIQEEINAPGTNPDIYLHTKHPILSDSLVTLLLPGEDARFEKYRELVQHLNPSAHSSTMVVDVLKALRDAEDLSQEKIDRLFDACSQIFDEDPWFNLYYAINLQYRNTEDSLHRGIERLQHAESSLERRSHRLVHRRAVLNFRLARLVSGREVELNETFKYIQQARNLFEIKLILDPFSSYSYIEYIRFEMWYWETVNLTDVEEIAQRIKIEDLLNRAEQSVTDNAHIITQLHADYLMKSGARTDHEQREYLDFLEESIKDPVKKPYALILKFYFYQRKKNEDQCAAIITQLESFTHLDEVGKVLFRYYGKHLYKMSNRIKFFDIINKYPKLEKTDSFLYHYYTFVAEAYNKNFKYAYEQVSALRGKVGYLNPALKEIWREEDTQEERVFEGIIRVSKNRKRIHVVELQQTVDLISGDYSSLPDGYHHDVILHFYPRGIRAQLVEVVYE